MPELIEPIKSTDRLLLTEPGWSCAIVDRGGRSRLVDLFGNEPGLLFCDRCRSRVPGVKDRSGHGNMLCWRCVEAMIDYWILHCRVEDAPQTASGCLADERFKMYLSEYEKPN